MANLRRLLTELYPGDEDKALEEIVKIKNRYDINPKTKKLDESDVILITYGDGLFDKSQAPLKTLKTFCADYLSESISAIHLLPCFPFSSDDGFSVIDYYEINPELGDWEDIRALAVDFHLMFDAVVNHMSKASKWFKSFLDAVPPYDDYFIKAEPDLDYSMVVRPRALPLLHGYRGKDDEVNVWTTFSEDQVDLNYKSLDVFLQILDVLLFYVSKGARFIRLDAIAFLWKEIGTTCIHLPETHMVIQAYRKIIDSVAPSTVLITETNVPHIENISYFGDGTNEAHMVYNFTLPPLLALSLHQENVETLVQWAISLQPVGNTCFFNFTASHDGVGVRPLQGIVSDKAVNMLADKALEHGGFVSFKDNGDGTRSPYELNCNYLELLTHPEAKDSLRIDRFLLTQSVMLCMPGVPGIYYHSLLGSQNDREAALASGINRRINREKLSVEELKDSLSSTDTLRYHIFQRYSAMLKVRRTEELFNPYGHATYKSQGEVFIIIRENERSVLYGIHNFSSVKRSLVAIAGTTFLYNSHPKSKAWELLPYQFQWLKIEK